MNDFLESLYPDQADFSQSMYSHGLYSTMFGLAAIIGLVVVVIFYYVVNSPRFNKRLHWFMMATLVVFINLIVVFQYPADVISKADDVNFGFNDWLIYGAVHSVWVVVLFTIFSLALKWWSRNCKTTPF
jgi:ABC-type branched-subunit amino acid transport system permease subunit